ncbi:MAG: hypothetical protein M9946_00640 [Nocardioidaceae bacterium]|nr:hypothetical protein [Nocardioidaceae bacterium]
MTSPRKAMPIAIIGVCLALALVLLTPSAGMAAKKRNKAKLSKRSLDHAAAAMPFVPRKMLRAQILQVAKLSKRNPNRVARATARQAHQSALNYMRVNANSSQSNIEPGVVPVKPGDKPGELPYAFLPTARNVGDIFYSPSRWYFIIFGHNGIYSGPNTIIQHPGGQEGQVVQEQPTWSMMVFHGARIGQVVDNNGNLVSAAKRQGAVNWARSRIGDTYNKNPLNTYHIASGPVGTDENAQNCSQLVWAAYKTQGIDLDDVNWNRDGALYGWMDRMSIMPLELLQSSHVRIYKFI